MAAPWITAPEVSVTIPVILPVVCAWAAEVASDARSRRVIGIGRRQRVRVRSFESELDTHADDDCGSIDPPDR